MSRSTWILLDQGLSSLFSLVFGFAAARALSAEHFGLFATLFTSFLLARGVIRSAALDPITIRTAGRRTADEAGFALATTFGVAGGATILAVMASPLVSSLTLDTALATGPALLTLLLIDTSRLLDIAAGRPRRAVESGVILLAGSLAILGVAWARPVGLVGLLLATALSGFVTLALRQPLRAPLPPPGAQLRWLAAQWRLAAPLLMEFLTNFGALFATVYLLAAIDLAEAGVLRAAQMVAGPLFMLFTGITQVVMTEGSRQMAAHPMPVAGPSEAADRLRAVNLTVQLARRAFALSAAVALGYLTAVALGQDLLASALKVTDPAHRGIFTGIVVLAGLTAPSYVAGGLVRALSRPELLLTARLVALVSILTSSIYGSFHGGATGVVHYGLVAEAVNIPLWTLAAAAATRSRRRELRSAIPT